MTQTTTTAAVSEETAYPSLFSPITLAGKTLKNRIVHASMTTRFVVKGQLTQQMIDYHRNRAEGGTAMTVTEPLNMMRFQSAPGKINVYGRANEDSLKAFADAVEGADCRLIGQVQDPGRGRHTGGRNTRAVGASALPDDLSWTVPYALSTDDVANIIDDFAQSSLWLKECGWSGIEISAGHGHIFHQFMSSWSNRRDDVYGGDVAGRTKLVKDLLVAIRQTCGSDFIIGIKLPGEDGIPNSIDMEEAGRISAEVASVNVADFVTFAWGAHGPTLDWHLPDMNGPRAPYMEKIVSLAQPFDDAAVGALGLITDPNEGDQMVRDGEADLVMLGRPLVTDPAWGRKSAAGREADIRYCVSCNTCWQVIMEHTHLQCDNNPRVGAPDEANWVPTPAKERKKITIVGAGVAGMECAWVASARGHDVTVFGQSPEPGGKTRLHAELPGGESLSSVYDYQALMAKKSSTRMELGFLATQEDILATEPDLVVLATGSSMSWPDGIPDIWEDEGIFLDLRTLMAELIARPSPQPGTAIIYDHDHTRMTYAGAEFLSDKFDRVIMVTPRERIASDEALVVRQGIYRRLMQKGIELVTLHDLDPESVYEEAEVNIRNVYTGATTKFEEVALLTYSTPRRPNIALQSGLETAGLKVERIGDARAPRTLHIATSEGYKFGNTV